MTAQVSIIIPTFNAAQVLPELLSDIVEGMVDGLVTEVIFADGGSTDETAAIAAGTGAIFFEAPKGRGSQQKAAAAIAKGRWILFLHADSRLPENWTSIIGTHLAEKTPAVFQLKFDSDGLGSRVTAGFANRRTRWFSLPYGDQGLLIPAQTYRDIGGHPEIPLMEDVAIARALKGSIKILPAKITTSSAKYRRNGWFRQGVRNLTTLARYRLGAPPEKLAESYYGKKR